MENVEEIAQGVSKFLDGQDLTLSSVLRVAVLVLVGWLVIRLLMKIVDRMLDRSRLTSAAKVYLSSVTHFLLWALLVLMLAETMGIKATSIIAMLSVAGLALSLALQNTLANLAGGMVLLAAKPFSVEDFVEADGVMGTVAAVNMSYTTLITPDNKEIFVPNSQLSATKIINYNRLGKRRMDLKFNIPYSVPTQRVREAILEVLSATPKILDDPAPVVRVFEYQSASVQYLARLWTPSADYWDIYFALQEGIRESLTRHGVEMAYNNLNVHIVE